MRLLLFLVAWCGIALSTYAQSTKTVEARPVADTVKPKADPEKKAKKLTLKISAGFNSNSVFLGRTDSIATPSYNTGITYTLKNGIFFSGSLSYIPSRQFDKLDGGSLETGYNFDLDNLSGGFTLSKYFASFNSTRLISALDATVGAELSYDLFEVVTPSVHADYALSRSGGDNDFLLNTGIDHEFGFDKVFGAHDHLAVSPAFHINSGTQNFYTTYITRKKASALKRLLHSSASVKSNGKGTSVSVSKGKGATTTTTSSTNKFQVLDYEWSAPLSYSIKKFAFEFSPTYAIAVHKTYDTGTQTGYLPNSSVFYFQFSVAYAFDLIKSSNTKKP